MQGEGGQKKAAGISPDVIHCEDAAVKIESNPAHISAHGLISPTSVGHT